MYSQSFFVFFKFLHANFDVKVVNFAFFNKNVFSYVILTKKGEIIMKSLSGSIAEVLKNNGIRFIRDVRLCKNSYLNLCF